MAKEINFNNDGGSTYGGFKIESKIKVDELDEILTIAKEFFPMSQFTNKDISQHVKSLSARQIPSRLKKLVEAGEIVDCGGSPKSYSIQR